MTLLVNVLGIAILSVIAYWGANTFFRARMSEALMENDRPYEKPSFDYTTTLLVLGDSLAVGVGAQAPEDSVAGRLAAYLDATYVENHAHPGAEVEDLKSQIKAAKLPKYDFILIQAGGNDILAMHDAKKTAKQLSLVLGALPPAGRIVLMTAGNVGGATLFPPPLRLFHTIVSKAMNREFARVAHGWHITFLDLFEPFYRDPFLQNPYRYLSRDGLHPSSYGYGLWFEKLKAALET
jgi:lysophospholipase L1-like esterase